MCKGYGFPPCQLCVMVGLSMQSWSRTLSSLCVLADIKHQLKVKAVETFISLAHDCFIWLHCGTLLITSAFIHLELAFRVKKKTPFCISVQQKHADHHSGRAKSL